MFTQHHILCAVTSTKHLQSSGVAAARASTLRRRADEARADGVGQVSRAAARREEIGNASAVCRQVLDQSHALHQRHSRPQFVQHRDLYRLRGTAPGYDALTRVAAQRPWEIGHLHRGALRTADDGLRCQVAPRFEGRDRSDADLGPGILPGEGRAKRRRARRSHARPEGVRRAHKARISEAVSNGRSVVRRVVEVRRRRIPKLPSIHCWIQQAYESRRCLCKGAKCKSVDKIDRVRCSTTNCHLPRRSTTPQAEA